MSMDVLGVPGMSNTLLLNANNRTYPAPSMYIHVLHRINRVISCLADAGPCMQCIAASGKSLGTKTVGMRDIR